MIEWRGFLTKRTWKRLFVCSFHAVIFLWKPSLLYQSHDRKVFAWMGAGQTYWLKYAWNFPKRSLLYLYKYLFYNKGVKWLVLKIIIGCNRHTDRSTFQKTVQKPARNSSELNGKLCNLGKRGKKHCVPWLILLEEGDKRGYNRKNNTLKYSKVPVSSILGI